jgi:hypothetical protein
MSRYTSHLDARDITLRCVCQYNEQVYITSRCACNACVSAVASLGVAAAAKEWSTAQQVVLFCVCLQRRR